LVVSFSAGSFMLFLEWRLQLVQWVAEQSAQSTCGSFSRAEQLRQIVIHQFADAFNGDVRRRIIGNGFGIQRVMALAREDGGEPVAP